MNIFKIILLTGAILCLLIFGLLFLRAWVGIEYKKTPVVTLKVLFFTFKLYPQKEKREKKEVKKKKTLKKSPRKEKAEKPSKEKKNIGEILSFYRELIEKAILPALGKLHRKIIIKPEKLHLYIANEDPAKTAVLYGGACAGIGAFIAFLEECFKVKRRKKALLVEPCFDRIETEIEIKLSFGLRVWEALYICLPALMKYLEMKEEKAENSTEAPVKSPNVIHRKFPKQP